MFMLGASNPAHWLYDRGFMKGYAEGYKMGYEAAKRDMFSNTGTSNFITGTTYTEVLDEARGAEEDS